MRHFLCVLALLPAAAVVPVGAAEVDLSPRYEQGDKLAFEAEVEIEQTLTLAGMDVETKVSTFEIKHQEVTGQAEGGGTKQRIHSSKLQFELTLPGGITVSFDSDNPDRESDVPELNDLLKMLKVASRTEMNAELDRQGQLKELAVKAEGAEDLDDTFKSYLEPDKLKQQLKQELERIPTRPVAEGDTWTRAETFDAGSGQIFTYTATYKYEGRVEEQGQTYDKVTATYARPTFEIQAGSQLPIAVKSSELSMEGSSATILLEVERHLIRKSSGESIFKGKLVFTDPNGTEIPGELDLKITSKLTRRTN
jgi:hypothetical protein